MRINTVIPEQIKPSTLFNGAPTGSADVSGIEPTKGSQSVTLLCLVTMANAADLPLSVVTADDGNGTNPVAITEDVPVFVDNVRQTDDAKSYTVTEDSALVLVSFHVPSILIPEDKFICLSYGASNAANVLSVVAFDDRYHGHG